MRCRFRSGKAALKVRFVLKSEDAGARLDRPHGNKKPSSNVLGAERGQGRSEKQGVTGGLVGKGLLTLTARRSFVQSADCWMVFSREVFIVEEHFCSMDIRVQERGKVRVRRSSERKSVLGVHLKD